MLGRARRGDGRRSPAPGSPAVPGRAGRAAAGRRSARARAAATVGRHRWAAWSTVPAAATTITAPTPQSRTSPALDQREDRERGQHHGHGRGDGQPVIHPRAPGMLAGLGAGGSGATGTAAAAARRRPAACAASTRPPASPPRAGSPPPRRSRLGPAPGRPPAAAPLARRAARPPVGLLAGLAGLGRGPVPWPPAAQVDTASSSAMAGPASRRLAASCRAHVGGQPAGDRDDQAALCRRAARPAPALKSRPREGLITASESSSTSSKMPAAGDRPGVGEQLAVQALAGQVHADRGGRADRELERGGRAGPGVGTAPGVEEQHRPVPPLLLLAAHHELAVPGRRAPVHPAQLVAVPVGPRDRRRPRPPRPPCGSGRRRRRPSCRSARPGAARPPWA